MPLGGGGVGTWFGLHTGHHTDNNKRHATKTAAAWEGRQGTDAALVNRGATVPLSRPPQICLPSEFTHRVFSKWSAFEALQMNTDSFIPPTLRGGGGRTPHNTNLNSGVPNELRRL